MKRISPEKYVVIEKQENGLWKGRVFKGYYGDKAQFVYINDIETESECKLKIDDLQKEYSVMDVNKYSAEMLFEEWIVEWLKYNVKRYTPKGQKEAERALFYVSNDIGKVRLKDITAGMLQKYYADLKLGKRYAYSRTAKMEMSSNTIRNFHSRISPVINTAVQIGLINKNPLEQLKPPKGKKADIRIMTNVELIDVLKTAKEKGYFEIYVLAAITGMLGAEIAGLRWSDLVFSKRELSIKRTTYIDKEGEVHVLPLKSKSAYRTIILPPEVVEIFRQLKKNSKSKWIFHKRCRKYQKENWELPITDNDIITAFKRISRKAGYEDISFSSLRNTFIVEALTYGMDAKMIAMVLGLSHSENIIKSYMPLVVTKKSKAAEKIELAIRPIFVGE